MNDGDYNYAEAFRKMMFYKEHHRPIEDIVAELQHELSPVKEESLLTHAMRMILELEYRTISPLYQHLQSPMKQTLYLMDVYYSISDREELVEMDKERWDRIALLERKTKLFKDEYIQIAYDHLDTFSYFSNKPFLGSK